MAKSALRLEAVRLRRQGVSVKEIARKLNIAKSTASLWVRDVILTIEQLETLRQNSITGRERGRLINSLKQKQARILRLENENKAGSDLFSRITPSELHVAGLCLYWAEGSKKQRRVELCNSDPQMIKFFITWLVKIYQIPLNELRCHVGINIAHKFRENQVKNYWSKTTGIPLVNFNKTSLKLYPLRKKYEHFSDHYGTLAVKIIKPARIYYKIMGQIHGLSLAT